MPKLWKVFDRVDSWRREANLSLFEKAHKMLKVVPESTRKYVEAMFRERTDEISRSWPHKTEHMVEWLEEANRHENYWKGSKTDYTGSGAAAEVRTRYDGFSLEGTFGWKDEHEAVAAIKELAQAWKKDFEMSYDICYRDPENDQKVSYEGKPEGYVLDYIGVSWKMKR